MRAYDEALLVQLLEIAAHGVGRHVEALGQLCDRDLFRLRDEGHQLGLPARRQSSGR
jgi:hypothetical protein